MIRVPRQFNGVFITRHFFPEFLSSNNVRGINRGYCYDWAYYAYRMFPGTTLWTTDFHAWIQVHDRIHGYRFFDSETHTGVKSFMELGCNRRHAPQPWDDQPPTQMGVEDFKKFWDHHGGGYKRHWDSMLETKLRKVLGSRFNERTPIFQEKIQPATVIP